MSYAFERFFCICFFAVLVFGLVLGRLGFASGVSDGDVSDAGARVGRAFEAVLEAEKAGANVSVLNAELNGAGGLLAEAEMAYRNGNLSGYEDKMSQCNVVAQRVLDAASSLKSSASADGERSFQLAFAFSLIGSVALVALLLAVWRRFRSAYLDRLMKTKPEAA